MCTLDPRILPPPASDSGYCSVFAFMDRLDDQMVKVWDLAQHQECCITGMHWMGNKMTIMDLAWIDADLNLFCATDATKAFSVDHSLNDFSNGVVEICAGTGSMGVGPLFMGAKILASVEVNALACDHLRRNQHGKVFERDLSDPLLVWDLHQHLGDQKATFLLGFPCQPFSRQGMQLGQSDNRTQTFWHALKLVFLLQGQALITECVATAAQDQELCSGLRSLAEHMHWTLQDTCLKLEDQWPCQRHRWWTISMPRTWASEPLRTWPRSYDHSVIARVLPRWGTFSEFDEDDLMLDQHELQMYSNPEFGTESRMLFPSKVCPTILHSYGSVLRECPCGCRAPISLQSLRHKGLRGVLVTSGRTNMPRYLHPMEVATLLTVPLSMEFARPPRSSLCLLGQVASPLQSLWVYSHLVNSAATCIPTLHSLDSCQVLMKYKEVLLQQVRTCFPFSVPCQPLQLQLFHRDGPAVQLLSCWGSTTAQLAGAEAISLGWGQGLHLKDDQGSVVAQNQSLLDAYRELHVEINGKKQCAEKPEGMLMIAIHTADQCATSFLMPGSFLFQACWEHDLASNSLFVDLAGKIHSSDYKVWYSKLLFLLHDQTFPTIDRNFGHLALKPPLASSSQAGGSEPGLDNHAIWAAMLDLQDNVDCLLVPPIELPDQWQGHLHRPEIYGTFSTSKMLFVIFQAKGHWGLLRGAVCGDKLSWTYFDGLRHPLQQQAILLARALTKHFGLSNASWKNASWISQLEPHTCGTIAIGHMAKCLGLEGSFDTDSIGMLHGLFACRNHKASWISGLGPAALDLQANLAAVLATKGVPLDSAASRATAAIQRLGATEVEQALQQKNSWQALKGLTTKPGKNFQFVLRTELQANIEAKAANKHGASISSKKKEKRQPRKDGPAQWNLDPKLLRLDPAHFEDEDEQPLEQIGLSNVVADARGIAFCTVAEAMPYVRESKTISTDALALLILEDIPSEHRAQANISSLRFPATFIPTEDPLLINGCILQLGDHEVSRSSPAVEVTDMDVGHTMVLKVMIYRDEYVGDWTELTGAPIRALIAKVPTLKLCNDLHCNMKCGQYHAGVEDPMDQVIHEIWARRFVDHAGRTCQAPMAEQFHAFLRISAPACATILEHLVEGIYFEPRAFGDAPQVTNTLWSGCLELLERQLSTS